ncbi:putative indole-3-pyruvate monooxygenase [Dioscorea sansibarensis]
MVVEFMSRWLVVATRVNAKAVMLEMKGTEVFHGSVLHSSEYENGMEYKGKKVLVVGCGNSGIEMCLDLHEHGAIPFIPVRMGVHVLPREILGTSTFKLPMKSMKRLCKEQGACAWPCFDFSIFRDLHDLKYARALAVVFLGIVLFCLFRSDSSYFSSFAPKSVYLLIKVRNTHNSTII